MGDMRTECQIETCSVQEETNLKSGANPADEIKVPEVEIHVYRRGKGPIDIFKTKLGGWDQNKLEVQDILYKYSFKSIFSFNPDSGRGVSIRFHPKNGRSMLSYSDGAVIFIDGEPMDSLINPITKILWGVAAAAFLITVIVRMSPKWTKTLNFPDGTFSPWVLACIIIVFTRLRKRTKNILEKYVGKDS